MGGLHVIIGEDDYLVSEAAKRLIGEGIGLETIDSANASNAELQLADLRAADASFSTPPFLEPSKVTWWKNVRFLPQGGKGGPSEEVKTALEKFARKLVSAPVPENQRFILSGPRLLATSIVAKTLKTAAEMVSFAAGKPWEAAKNAAARVRDAAAEQDLTFARGALETFVARVGTDSRSLMNELAKLRDYLGGALTVSESDIAAITSPGVGVEPEIWSVTDAIGARDIAAAVAAVGRFAGENGFAVMLTTVIEKFFRQLVELKDAEERGALAAATEGMNPFVVKKNAAFLRNWTLRELRMARYRFLTLREKAVSSAGSVDVLVETELVRALRRSR
jgi:DNA polymerase III delta subunit